MNWLDDFNIILKQPDGSELVFNTALIYEDVLRLRCGLAPAEQD